MSSALVVIRDRIARERFGGRTLIERHVENLRRAGIDDVRVVDAGEAAAARSALSAGDHGRRLLVVAAERIFDPRLYAHAMAQPAPAVMADRGEPIGLEVDDDGRPQTRIDIAAMDSYSRELRRAVPAYWMRVNSDADRPAVARMLVEASGKGHQDLPAIWINAPIEKAIARRLADTGVTPNQITLFCNVLAYGVALLLARGQLLAGAIGAMIVGVVDGLDGRQARVQARTSRLGRVEHLLDKVYEVLWMAALAYYLSGGLSDAPFVTGLWIWVAAYFLDTAAYDVMKWRRGVQLDEATRIDAALRLVAGRRNVYATMLLVGVVLGRPASAFHAIVWWAAATALVHWLRVAWLLGWRPR